MKWVVSSQLASWCFDLNTPFSLPGGLVLALKTGQQISLQGTEGYTEFVQIPTMNMQIKQTSKALVGSLQQVFWACITIYSYFDENSWTECAGASRKQILAVSEQGSLWSATGFQHSLTSEVWNPHPSFSVDSSWALMGSFSQTKEPPSWLFPVLLRFPSSHHLP